MTAAPRVLVVSHLYPSATRPVDGPWLADQVRALVASGVSVEVLCCSQFEDDREEILDDGTRVHYRGTSVGGLKGGRAGLAASTLRYTGAVERFLAERAESYDLVHAHFGFPDAWATVPVARRQGLPVVVTLHGSDARAALARGCPFGMSVRSRVRRADVVICVSGELTARVHRVMDHAVRIVTVENGFDDSLFSPHAGTRDLGFLFLGMLRDVKNVDLLLDTYLADRALWAVPLTIAGDGPLRERLEARAAAQNANVRFTGWLTREQAADAMRRATALVMPSRSEGWGVAAAEAVACGTPVVGSRVGGLPVILASERTGVLVSPGDAAELAAAMHRTLSWPWTPAEIAAANGGKPWSIQARLIKAFYDELVR